MFNKKSNLINKRLNNKRALFGFTIIELIFTMFILIIGVFAIYGVYSIIVSDTNLSVSKLTAAYLAQEGIEIVRNIRDTNWVEGAGHLWDEGLIDNLNGWEADYTTTSFNEDCGSPSNYNCRQYNNTFLRISDFYNHTAGATTKFRRKITIEHSGGILKVLSRVDWQEKGASYNISIQENLHPWYPY